MSMPHCVSVRTFAKALLNRYAQQNRNGSAYDLESPKGFVFEMACSIDGVEGIDETCEETVRKYRNNFIAARSRSNPSIPRDIMRSITNICLSCDFGGLCVTWWD